MEAANPKLVWELTVLSSEELKELGVKVKRVDDRSIVFRIVGEKMTPSEIKLCFDVTSKRILKRLEYPSLPVL